MSKKNRTTKVFVAGLALYAGMSGRAQTPEEVKKLPEAPKTPVTSIESLNYLGGDAAMPPLSDSIVDISSGYRRAFLRKGMALRVIAQAQYAQNVLDAPVSADEQVYAGQRPFGAEMVQPILTSDLRLLHLRTAQLYVGGVWNWVSWNPAGPKSLQLWDLYLYKSFGEDRVQIKAGYISMSLDFIGLFVGGSTATGTQGVYAVLPYEAGMSYFPLTTAGFTLRAHGPNRTYLKSGAQRSIDPEGGPREVERNHTGFRFIPHGDKLLLINEGGYLRDADQRTHEAWFRAGYMYNNTAYQSAKTGKSESGNYCGFVLMDYQLRQSSPEHPSHGLYAGASFMTVPDTLNPYARYYEARLYKEAPFRSRPVDLASLVASRTGYSSYFTNNFAAEGKSVWRGGTTLTGSYSSRVLAGNYLSVALSYVYGPAITPRVPNALKFVATWTAFF